MGHKWAQPWNNYPGPHTKITTLSSAFELNIICYFTTISITEYQLAVLYTVSQFYRSEIQAHNVSKMGSFGSQGGRGLF